MNHAKVSFFRGGKKMKTLLNKPESEYLNLGSFRPELSGIENLREWEN